MISSISTCTLHSVCNKQYQSIEQVLSDARRQITVIPDNASLSVLNSTMIIILQEYIHGLHI